MPNLLLSVLVAGMFLASVFVCLFAPMVQRRSTEASRRFGMEWNARFQQSFFMAVLIRLISLIFAVFTGWLLYRLAPAWIAYFHGLTLS
jgi:hypothetical protein